MISSVPQLSPPDKQKFSLLVDGFHLKARLVFSDAEAWHDTLKEIFPRVAVSIVRARRGMRR